MVGKFAGWYISINVTLKSYDTMGIEKEIVEIPQSVGMQQGDNMAPVLFLFLMIVFAETLETVWRE